MRLLISAGEASGEMYGAELLAALQRKLRARGEAVECFGLGGERMRAAGCETVIDAKDVAVVGLFEVLTHLPKIYGEFQKLLRAVDERKPDVAVLIDFPDFNFRLAKELHKRGIPVVYYISPQLWAWRPKRVELVKKYVRKMLVIFPFEREFYQGHGVQVEFVGHPLTEMERPMTPAAGAGLHLQGTTKPETMIALLPGSRRKEVRINLPAMIAATYHVRQRSEFVIPVASTLDKAWVEDQAMWYWKPVMDRRVAEGKEAHVLNFSNDARQTLAGARAAIVASGTATVEAAVIGTPFVMVYRVSPVTYVLGKRLVKVPFYAMPNLIAGRQVIPELVQGDFTAERVAAELNKIILDGPEREKMVAGLAEVRAKLRGTDTVGASERAADAVLSVAAGR
jgi:lipid-A-disaccharide synthase